MEELARVYALPVALALIIGYLSRYTEPRSRIIHWFPIWFQFQVPVPNGNQTVHIWTHQLTVQNVGYRPARSVEIVHRQRPQQFQIRPGVEFTETTNPTGEHVISIATLAPKEFVAIQILAVGMQRPDLLGIRSADGPSRFTQVGLRFVRPWWRLLIVRALLVVGFVTTFYWIARLIGRYGPMLLSR
jgi:hypothetical protein